MSHCSPEWLSAAALSRRRRSGSRERPHGVEKSPHPLCFVACLVTSNNRLALKSPGRGLETFLPPLSSITRSQIFRFDAQLSVAVTEQAWTDAAPSAVIDAETVGNVSQLILATANCQRGSEERGKKWHLGGKGGGVSGKQRLLNVLTEVG